jgi:beta-N-acetylhexosaminidase
MEIDDVFLNARMIAQELADLGITTNCAPLADIPTPGAHDIIGDRAFGTAAEQVTRLARAQADGLMAGGITPILKHIPGHGRSHCDSHEELPVVDTPLDVLEATDFKPFCALRDIPLGMTAHILYTALDAKTVATQSKKVIDYIRNNIGFDGLLMSDDLSMKALKGTYAERTKATFTAGCDLALHCNGNMAEMLEVAQQSPELTGDALRRAQRAKAMLPLARELTDADMKNWQKSVA